MRLKLDEQTDALFLSLSRDPADRTEEIAPGIIFDYDEKDRVVGIEMLYLSKSAPASELRSLLYESVPSPP